MEDVRDVTHWRKKLPELDVVEPAQMRRLIRREAPQIRRTTARVRRATD